MRRAAEVALGPKFDLLAFHGIVLNSGPMPLNLLKAKVSHWVQEFPEAVQTKKPC
jgi:uncharacterized protein (DUF885 family)